MIDGREEVCVFASIQEIVAGAAAVPLIRPFIMTLCCTSKVSPQHLDVDEFGMDVCTLEDVNLGRANGADLRRVIARSGGLAPELRPLLWPPLLSLCPWPGAPFVDPAESERTLNAEYEILAERATEVNQSLVATIDADVPRTESLTEAQRAWMRSLLLAHCVLEPKWGYFQGMNDMAQVVLAAEMGRTAEDSKHGSMRMMQVAPSPPMRKAAREPPQPEQQAQVPTPQLVPQQDEHGQARAGAEGGAGLDDGLVTFIRSKSLEKSLGHVFWLLKGVLAHSKDNWAHSGLEGVWRQARAVRGILNLVDRRLCKQLDSWDRNLHGMAATESEQPLAFLFGPIFLRLKREMIDVEETMRLWEVSWARGKHFHVLVLAAFVRRQREPILKIRGNGAAEIHQIFQQLHGTMRAAPLLRAAHALEMRPGVLEIVENIMGTMAIRSIV